MCPPDDLLTFPGFYFEINFQTVKGQNTGSFKQPVNIKRDIFQLCSDPGHSIDHARVVCVSNIGILAEAALTSLGLRHFPKTNCGPVSHPEVQVNRPVANSVGPGAKSITPQAKSSDQSPSQSAQEPSQLPRGRPRSHVEQLEGQSQTTQWQSQSPHGPSQSTRGQV